METANTQLNLFSLILSGRSLSPRLGDRLLFQVISWLYLANFQWVIFELPCAGFCASVSKRVSAQNLSCDIEFHLHAWKTTCRRNSFSLNGLAFRLVLIQRRKVTRKWPIVPKMRKSSISWAEIRCSYPCNLIYKCDFRRSWKLKNKRVKSKCGYFHLAHICSISWNPWQVPFL